MAKKLLLAVELVTLMATIHHVKAMVHITSQITGHKLCLLDMGIVDDSRIVHDSPMLGAQPMLIQRNTSVWIFPSSSILRIPNGCHGCLSLTWVISGEKKSFYYNLAGKVLLHPLELEQCQMHPISLTGASTSTWPSCFVASSP